MVEMQRHTEYGAQYLLAMGADPLAITTAFDHHRTMDNGGYPQVQHRAPLALPTRLIKICDVYEALTGLRPYRERVPPVNAYRIMISMGDHFDRGLLHRFIRASGAYPVASWVELSSGEVGYVELQTGVFTRPIVRVEGAAVTIQGERELVRTDPRLLDLAADAEAQSVWVATWLGFEDPIAA